MNDEAIHAATEEQIEGLRWPVEELERALARPDVVGSILSMLLNPDGWETRRSEKLEFEGATRVRRTMKVTATIPEHVPTILVGGDEIRVIPFAYMRKRKLSDFDVRDDHGTAISLRPSWMGRTVARHMMAALARRLFVMGDRTADLDEALLAIFAKSTEDKRTTAADEDRTKQRVEDALSVVRGRRLDPRVREALLESAAEDGPDVTPEDAVFTTYSTLLRRLALNLLCLVAVPTDHPADIDMSYSLVEPVTFGHARESFRHRVAMRMGWRPWQIYTPVPAAATSPRYHVELKAPLGTEALIGRIVAIRPNPADDCPTPDQLSSWSRAGTRAARTLRRRQVSDDGVALQRLDRGPKEVEEYPTSNLPLVATMDPARALKVYGVFTIRLQRKGWLRASLLCCSAITGILLFLGTTAEEPAPDGPPSPMLIFLSLLTLATAMLTRSVEHPLATELLEGIRSAVLAVCVAPVAASLAVLGFGEWEDVTLTFRILGAACLVVTGILLVTYSRSMPVRKATLHYVAPGIGGDAEEPVAMGPLRRAHHRRAAQMLLALRINEGWHRTVPVNAPRRRPTGERPRRHRSVPYSIGIDTVRAASDVMISGVRIGTNEANRYALEDGWNGDALVVFNVVAERIAQEPAVIDLRDRSGSDRRRLRRVRRRLSRPGSG